MTWRPMSRTKVLYSSTHCVSVFMCTSSKRWYSSNNWPAPRSASVTSGKIMADLLRAMPGTANSKESRSSFSASASSCTSSGCGGDTAAGAGAGNGGSVAGGGPSGTAFATGASGAAGSAAAAAGTAAAAAGTAAPASESLGFAPELSGASPVKIGGSGPSQARRCSSSLAPSGVITRSRGWESNTAWTSGSAQGPLTLLMQEMWSLPSHTHFPPKSAGNWSASTSSSRASV
mmetsp:Transcript_86332/g.252636  ORF Transcript_86332/g.252636 Transcript_86332/m.252636 type:complete len:232 (-) Transcript_86332:780-1475(-)